MNHLRTEVPKTKDDMDYAREHPISIPLAEAFDLTISIKRAPEVVQPVTVIARNLESISELLNMSYYGMSTDSVEWSESNRRLNAQAEYRQPRHIMYANDLVREKVDEFRKFSQASIIRNTLLRIIKQIIHY
jgi:hypothetical protein